METVLGLKFFAATAAQLRMLEQKGGQEEGEVTETSLPPTAERKPKKIVVARGMQPTDPWVTEWLRLVFTTPHMGAVLLHVTDLELKSRFSSAAEQCAIVKKGVVKVMPKGKTDKGMFCIHVEKILRKPSTTPALYELHVEVGFVQYELQRGRGFHKK
jgi:hypothetical protein